MGIDAEILIRYRGEKPTDEQLTRWSWDLCRSVGAAKFFISDGLPPEAHRLASKQWSEAYEAHEKAGKSRDQIVAAIGEYPQQLRRAIELTGRRYPHDDESGVPEQYRAPGLAYTQDGPDIYAEPGEYLLEVALWTRYYGPGYERGDILTICAVAEWIEANMQPCEVWYGGDSSGVCVEPFGAAAREALRKHLYSRQGRDYFKHGERSGFPTPAPCGLCVPGENRLNRHGWGKDYVAVNCAGCGKSFESSDNGKTWVAKKEA